MDISYGGPFGVDVISYYSYKVENEIFRILTEERLLELSTLFVTIDGKRLEIRKKSD